MKSPFLKPRTGLIASLLVAAVVAAPSLMLAYTTIDGSLGLGTSGSTSLRLARVQTSDRSCAATASPRRVIGRAWTIQKGWTAPQAAGVIHSDFERGFIKAEVIWWEDLVALGSEAKCRDAGKLAIVGRDYVVRDGDVVHFRFNV